MQADWFSDEEIDGMVAETLPQQEPAPPAQDYPGSAMAPVPLYPMSLASTEPNGSENFLTKKLGPLPVWGWGAIVAAVGGGGYLYWRYQKNVKPNGEDDVEPNLGDIVPVESNGDSRSWSPSRASVASALEKHYGKKGQKDLVVIWSDADEAKEKGKLQFVSPLVNVQPQGVKVKVDQALTRLCRREGLNPVQHQDGSIGLYPHTGRRGQEWEEYVDALRDEGQKV